MTPTQFYPTNFADLLRYSNGYPKYFNNPETGCRVWSAGKSSTGYGTICLGRKRWNVHQLAWVLKHGPYPSGMELDHICRNRACFNLDHLELVSKVENIRRSASTRLTLDIVKEIRARRSSGETTVEIAKSFGINTGHVSRICAGKAWRVDEWRGQ